MPSASPRTTSLRAAAAATDTAPVALLVHLLQGPLADSERPGSRHTLLAVCPNSRAVVPAALQAAQEAHAPLLFAATLNQVDRDGGYTGWTPATFATTVDEEKERLEIDTPVFLGLDHGGPWKKDRHVRTSLDYDETLNEVKRSITACVEAGYDLLHLDPTTDRRRPAGSPVPVDALVTRTVALMQHAEEARRTAGTGPIAYEVGTEEVGGPESEDRLRAFMDRLADTLDNTPLPRPSFVVGDVGTRLHASAFDADRAHRLTRAAMDRLGALLKGHFTDDVVAPERYPLSGMGGANVGPGLAVVEAEALRELVSLEHRLDKRSGLIEALRTAVIESERWRKWLRAEEEGRPFDALAPDRQRWLVNSGSRYVWTTPAVEEARAALYDHVAPYRNAEAYVQWRLKNAIFRYLHAFNLVGLSDRLRPALANRPSES